MNTVVEIINLDINNDSGTDIPCFTKFNIKIPKRHKKVYETHLNRVKSGLEWLNREGYPAAAIVTNINQTGANVLGASFFGTFLKSQLSNYQPWIDALFESHKTYAEEVDLTAEVCSQSSSAVQLPAETLSGSVSTVAQDSAILLDPYLGKKSEKGQRALDSLRLRCCLLVLSEQGNHSRMVNYTLPAPSWWPQDVPWGDVDADGKCWNGHITTNMPLDDLKKVYTACMTAKGVKIITQSDVEQDETDNAAYAIPTVPDADKISTMQSSLVPLAVARPSISSATCSNRDLAVLLDPNLGQDSEKGERALATLRLRCCFLVLREQGNQTRMVNYAVPPPSWWPDGIPWGKRDANGQCWKGQITTNMTLNDLKKVYTAGTMAMKPHSNFQADVMNGAEEVEEDSTPMPVEQNAKKVSEMQSRLLSVNRPSEKTPSFQDMFLRVAGLPPENQQRVTMQLLPLDPDLEAGRIDAYVTEARGTKRQTKMRTAERIRRTLRRNCSLLVLAEQGNNSTYVNYALPRPYWWPPNVPWGDKDASGKPWGGNICRNMSMENLRKVYNGGLAAKEVERTSATAFQSGSQSGRSFVSQNGQSTVNQGGHPASDQSGQSRAPAVTEEPEQTFMRLPEMSSFQVSEAGDTVLLTEVSVNEDSSFDLLEEAIAQTIGTPNNTDANVDAVDSQLNIMLTVSQSSELTLIHSYSRPPDAAQLSSGPQPLSSQPSHSHTAQVAVAQLSNPKGTQPASLQPSVTHPTETSGSRTGTVHVMGQKLKKKKFEKYDSRAILRKNCSLLVLQEQGNKSRAVNYCLPPPSWWPHSVPWGRKDPDGKPWLGVVCHNMTVENMNKVYAAGMAAYSAPPSSSVRDDEPETPETPAGATPSVQKVIGPTSATISPCTAVCGLTAADDGLMASACCAGSDVDVTVTSARSKSTAEEAPSSNHSDSSHISDASVTVVQEHSEVTVQAKKSSPARSPQRKGAVLRASDKSSPVVQRQSASPGQSYRSSRNKKPAYGSEDDVLPKLPDENEPVDETMPADVKVPRGIITPCEVPATLDVKVPTTVTLPASLRVMADIHVPKGVKVPLAGGRRTRSSEPGFCGLIMEVEHGQAHADTSDVDDLAEEAGYSVSEEKEYGLESDANDDSDDEETQDDYEEETCDVKNIIPTPSRPETSPTKPPVPGQEKPLCEKLNKEQPRTRFRRLCRALGASSQGAKDGIVDYVQAPPSWWPEDVPWGTRGPKGKLWKGIISKNMNTENLRKVIEAGNAHRQAPPLAVSSRSATSRRHSPAINSKAAVRRPVEETPEQTTTGTSSRLVRPANRSRKSLNRDSNSDTDHPAPSSTRQPSNSTSKQASASIRHQVSPVTRRSARQQELARTSVRRKSPAQLKTNSSHESRRDKATTSEGDAGTTSTGDGDATGAKQKMTGKKEYENRTSLRTKCNRMVLQEQGNKIEFVNYSLPAPAWWPKGVPWGNTDQHGKPWNGHISRTMSMDNLQKVYAAGKAAGKNPVTLSDRNSQQNEETGTAATRRFGKRQGKIRKKRPKSRTAVTNIADKGRTRRALRHNCSQLVICAQNSDSKFVRFALPAPPWWPKGVPWGWCDPNGRPWKGMISSSMTMDDLWKVYAAGMAAYGLQATDSTFNPQPSTSAVSDKDLVGEGETVQEEAQPECSLQEDDVSIQSQVMFPDHSVKSDSSYDEDAIYLPEIGDPHRAKRARKDESTANNTDHCDMEQRIQDNNDSAVSSDNPPPAKRFKQ